MSAHRQLLLRAGHVGQHHAALARQPVKKQFTEAVRQHRHAVRDGDSVDDRLGRRLHLVHASLGDAQRFEDVVVAERQEEEDEREVVDHRDALHRLGPCVDGQVGAQAGGGRPQSARREVLAEGAGEAAHEHVVNGGAGQPGDATDGGERDGARPRRVLHAGERRAVQRVRVPRHREARREQHRAEQERVRHPGRAARPAEPRRQRAPAGAAVHQVVDHHARQRDPVRQRVVHAEQHVELASVRRLALVPGDEHRLPAGPARRQRLRADLPHQPLALLLRRRQRRLVQQHVLVDVKPVLLAPHEHVQRARRVARELREERHPVVVRVDGLDEPLGDQPPHPADVRRAVEEQQAVNDRPVTVAVLLPDDVVSAHDHHVGAFALPHQQHLTEESIR